MRSTRQPAKVRAEGFSLLEVLVSMAILVVVIGAVFDQINNMHKKSASEAIKLDMSQQAREFVDQMMHDVHMAGYPNASMYAPGTADSTRIAIGLVSVSPTSLILEGDVDNDGNVESVQINYVAADPNDPNCPCIRRSAVIKVPGDSLSQPIAANYTETQHVFPPDQAGEDLFAFYDLNGNLVPVGSGVDIVSNQALISSINTVKVNLTLLTNIPDPTSGGFMRTSLSGTARLNH